MLSTEYENNYIKPMILCVDDEPANLRLLLDILREDYSAFAAPSAERALRFLENHRPDLILLDMEMPKMDGCELMIQIKESPQWRDIPVIFLSDTTDKNKIQSAFSLGAVEHIRKPIWADEVKVRVSLQVELSRYCQSLDELVEQRTKKIQQSQECVFNMLASMPSYHDNETIAHNKRTTLYCQVMVNSLILHNHPTYSISEEYGNAIVKSAQLHDIGKVGVPDSILLKPAKLTPAEYEAIKMHTTYGAEIIDNAVMELDEPSPFLNVAREIVIAHHEKWDGTGYPNGLKAKEIPLSARIMAIADVYDGLISYKPYRGPFTHDEALDIIRTDAGTHFDPDLIALLDNVWDTFPQIAQTHKDDISIMM